VFPPELHVLCSNRFETSNSFHFELVSGAHETMYITNAYGCDCCKFKSFGVPQGAETGPEDLSVFLICSYYIIANMKYRFLQLSF